MQEKPSSHDLVRDMSMAISFSENETMSSIKIGTFILEINDWEQEDILSPRSIGRYFSQEEQAHCANRIESYAGRFAGKNAVAQIIGGNFSLQEISIEALPTRQPVVRLSREAQEALGDKNVLISISHDVGLAVAMAIAIPRDYSSVGIGTDVSSNERIYNALQKHKDRFIKRQFTEVEAEQAGEDASRFAQKWAGKEAVAKVLGTGLWREGISWTDIEVLSLGNGDTVINLFGGALERSCILGFQDFKIHLVSQQESQIAFVLAC